MKNAVYVIALFAGRVDTQSFPLYFQELIQKHLFAINEFDPLRISKIVVVVNSLNPAELTKLFAETTMFQQSKIPVQILIRNNQGYSYGAWEYGILANLEEEVDGYFIIEDDYLPSAKDFLKFFTDKLSEEVCFVAQAIEALTGTAPVHAAVSNGLLSRKAALTTLQRFDRLFAIYPFELNRGDHLMGTENQVTFLAFIQESGYLVDEIADICSVPFHETIDNSIRERGNPAGIAPISPISMFR